MHQSAADLLADWILQRCESPITHLKLQKLAFYGYGALLAYGREEELGGELIFEPWEHGPVCRAIWRRFKDVDASPIQPASAAPSPLRLSSESESLLRDVLEIYGSLDAWSLRQQSHLEKPWRDAYQARRQRIDGNELREFFKEKFLSTTFRYPEYFGGSSSLSLDGIPQARFDGLRGLASHLRTSPAP